MNGKSLNSVQILSIALLERLCKTSKALRILLSNIDNDQDLEHSCGIILRSSLLDTLIAFNLYTKHINAEINSVTKVKDEEQINEFCDKALADGLVHTIKYIKAAKDSNIIDQQQLEQTYKNLTENYSTFFDSYPNDGTTPELKSKYKQFLSPEKLFKSLAQAPKFKELSKIYESYLFFSKYDHFGIQYYEVSRKPFSDKKNLIKQAIDFFVGIQVILHDLLDSYSNNDLFLKNQAMISGSYLSEKMLNVTKP